MILVRPFCSYTQVVTDLVEEIDGFMTQRALHFPAAPKFQEPEGILGTTEAREMTRRPLLCICRGLVNAWISHAPP